jgi:hypothetical protein
VPWDALPAGAICIPLVGNYRFLPGGGRHGGALDRIIETEFIANAQPDVPATSSSDGLGSRPGRGSRLSCYARAAWSHCRVLHDEQARSALARITSPTKGRSAVDTRDF